MRRLLRLVRKLANIYDGVEFVRFAYSSPLSILRGDKFDQFLEFAFSEKPQTLYHYASERAALFDYLRSGKETNKHALLQRGTCAAVPSAFEKAGWTFEFYGQRNSVATGEVIRRGLEAAETPPSLVLVQAQFGSPVTGDYATVAKAYDVRLILDSALTCITEYTAPVLTQFDAIFLSFDSTKPIPLGYGGTLLSFRRTLNTSIHRESLALLLVYMCSYNLQAFLGRTKLLSPRLRVIAVELFSILKAKIYPHFLRNDSPGSPIPNHYLCRFPPVFGGILHTAHLDFLREKPRRIARKFQFLSFLSVHVPKTQHGLSYSSEWDPLRFPIAVDLGKWDVLPEKIRAKAWFNNDVIGSGETEICDAPVLNLPAYNDAVQEKCIANFVEKYLVRDQK